MNTPVKKYAGVNGLSDISDDYGPGSQFYRLPEGVNADDVMTYKGIADEAHPDGNYQDTYGNIAKMQARMIASQQGFQGGTPPTGVTPVGTPLQTTPASPTAEVVPNAPPPGGPGMQRQGFRGEIAGGGDMQLQPPAPRPSMGSTQGSPNGSLTQMGGPTYNPALQRFGDAPASMADQISYAGGSRTFNESAPGGGMSVPTTAADMAKNGIANLSSAYAAIAGQSKQYQQSKAAAKMVANVGVAPVQPAPVSPAADTQIKAQEAMQAPSMTRQTAATGINFGQTQSAPIQGFTPSSIKSLF